MDVSLVLNIIYTVYIQIFEGYKFCCFCSQMVIRKIFILENFTGEIGKVKKNDEVDTLSLNQQFCKYDMIIFVMWKFLNHTTL